MNLSPSRITLTILMKVKFILAIVINTPTPREGHRAISHGCNSDTFLKNNISNWVSNDWLNWNNPDLSSSLLTLIETTNVIYQSKVVIYVMCIGCRAGRTKGKQGQYSFKIHTAKKSFKWPSIFICPPSPRFSNIPPPLGCIPPDTRSLRGP